MLALLTGTTALVAHGPLTVTRAAVAYTPAASLGRADAPVMILPPVVRGAVIGGAAVGLVKTLLERQPKTYTTGEADVTKADVLAAQALWAKSIASISKVHADKGDFVAAAGEAAGKLYGYGHGNVLFKPTKATDHPFRATGEEAMSYFVGSEAMKNDKYKGEDAGFAINGGRGWTDVQFNNHQVELYGYGKCDVLFKPTKSTKNPFRPTGEDAMSYFVGSEAMKNNKFKGEDAGFAINGGKGWKDVTFRNHKIDLNGPTAQAMGDYVFTDATSGDKVRVEYTFGYKRNADSKVRIYLHHSSVPFVA